MTAGGIQFDKSISLGNVLTILGMIVAGAMAWGALTSQAAADRKKLEVLEQRVERLAQSDEALRVSQANIEREMVRAITRLETLIGAMHIDLQRIGRVVERDPSRP